MRRRLTIVAAVVLVCAAAVVFAETSTQKEAEAYIKQNEELWAAASAKQDTATVERIVADDFVGVDTQGNFFRKSEELDAVRKNEGGYVEGKVAEVNVRFFGEAAVAQGSETWRKRNGEQGRYVWTDTWIHRDGKWQIVASEDLKAPEKSK
jgi:hypothetical protein